MESNSCSYDLASRELDNFFWQNYCGALHCTEQNLINATDIPQKNCVMFVKFSCKHKRLGNHSPKGLNRIVVLITLLLSSFYINLANQQQILEFKFDFSLSFCLL